MYENLPATGPAVFVVGGVAVFAWQLALLLLTLGILMIVGIRLAAR